MNFTPIILATLSQSSPRSAQDKSINDLLLNDAPVVSDDFCIFRFKPESNLIDTTLDPTTFKDEVWNAAVELKSNAVIFDMSNVQHIDDVFISMLIGLHKQFQRAKVPFGLCSLNHEVSESIGVRRLNSYLCIRDSLDELKITLSPMIPQEQLPREVRIPADNSGTVFQARSNLAQRRLEDVLTVTSIKNEITVTFSHPPDVDLRHGVSGIDSLTTSLGDVNGMVVTIDFSGVGSIGDEVVSSLLSIIKKADQTVLTNLAPPIREKLNVMRLNMLPKLSIS